MISLALFALALPAAALPNAARPSPAPPRPSVSSPQEAEPPRTAPVLTETLAAHPYFKTIRWSHHGDSPAFDLYVQTPANQSEFYVPKLTKLYGPWTEALRQAFEEEYVVPGELVRRPTSGENAVVPLSLMVLASSGDYLNYIKRAKIYDEFNDTVAYDAKLGLIVTFQDATENLPVHMRRSRVLHCVVHALLHRYSDPSRRHGAPTPGSLWFHEGLADYLSHHVARKPEGLSDRPLSTTNSRLLYDLYKSPKERKAYCPQLEFMLSAKDLFAITDQVQRIAKAEGLEYSWWHHARGYHSTCSTLVHYLHEHQNGQYREQAVRYLAEVLKGKDGKLAFQEVFAGLKPKDLESRLPNYLLTNLGGTPASPPKGASAEENTPLEPPPPNLDLLALRADEVDAGISFAVVTAMRGELEEALTSLETLASEVEGDAARIVQERTRIAAFRDLRDAFFARLVKNGERLTLQHGGERLRAKIRAIEDGEALFEKSTRGIDRLALREIDSVALSRAIGSKNADLAAPWVRFYPICATVDEKWKKLTARIEGPEIQALRTAAESEYPSWMARGRAAQGLTELFESGLPESADQAALSLERIEALVGAYSTYPLVESRIAPLRRLAETALRLRFAALSLGDVLQGEFEDLGDERIRLRYSFADPAAKEDWIQDDTLLMSRRKGFKVLQDPDPDKPFEFRDKSLGGVGAAALYHVVDFAPPLRVSLKGLWADIPALAAPAWNLEIGACLDEAGNYLYWDVLTTLAFRDSQTRTGERIDLQDQSTMFCNQSYQFELALDETGQASGIVDGNSLAQINAPQAKQGKVFLWVHTDLPLKIPTLEIEGRVTPEGKTRLQSRWVESELARLGLAP